MEGRFNGGFFVLLVWGAYIWNVEHSAVLIMLFSDDDDEDEAS